MGLGEMRKCGDKKRSGQVTIAGWGEESEDDDMCNGWMDGCIYIGEDDVEWG